MAAVDWFAAEAVAAPAPARPRVRAVPRRRTRRKQRRVTAGVLWISTFALLLAGVVAVNVAVLRANVAVDNLDKQELQLQAENAALASQVSSAVASIRIEQAARRFGLKRGAVLHALTTRGTHFRYVERKAPPDKASLLAKRKLPGFHFYGEERRTYPQASVAAQVLGYAGVDNNGLAGLELELNQELTGIPGQETILRDPFGRAIDVQSVSPARPGKDVFLTIDHRIQANVEQVLRATVAKWHAKDATAIVLDPHTGGVLAMATEPGYDANNYPRAFVKGLTGNRAISDVYEPGSVFKVVTIGGALAEHLVTPHTSFLLPYSIHVADRVVHDAERRPTERMTVSQILQRSSNVGAVTIARTKLGESRLKDWIHRFGFGRPTGIDFPAESAGLLPPYWSGSTIVN